MPITFPLSVPAIGGIARVRFQMIDAVGSSESPYTLSQEIFEHPGRRWGIEVELIPMLRPQAEEWVAFLAALRGRRGTFLLGDPLGKTPRGAGTGTPYVKGSGQAVGGPLLIDGVGANVLNWLRKGDWVQQGSGASAHLHKSLSDASSNAFGEVSLDLWPGPRTPLADNAPLVVINTRGVWRLASNAREVELGAGQIFGMTFSAVEAL